MHVCFFIYKVVVSICLFVQVQFLHKIMSQKQKQNTLFNLKPPFSVAYNIIGQR